MKKKIYRTPAMELIEFDLRNVIATSGDRDDFDEQDPGNPLAAPKRPNAIWE